jgi:hypothetical protein
VGAEGSGVPRLMERLFEANRIDPASMQLSRLDQTPAVMALLAGEIDALVLASAPESLMVQMLLQTPDIRLMDFSQSEAYARRLPFLTPVTLPRGVVDLAGDVPAQDVRLIATTTLLAPGGAPGAAAAVCPGCAKLHGQAGWFAAPAVPAIGQRVPAGAEAGGDQERRAALQRYLPFTLANLLERMWLALGIIIAILLPLSRIVPPLYEFRIRSRVFRWYGQLRQLEERLQAGEGTRAELLEALNALEARVGRIRVPLSYADELYALRNNIELVRRKLMAN